MRSVGEDVPPTWLGRRVWCYGAQNYRPFGTAAEYTDHVCRKACPLSRSACLGIPVITVHRSVHVALLKEKRFWCRAAQSPSAPAPCSSARRAGARVIASERAQSDKEIASRMGADEVVLADKTLTAQIKVLALEGVDHIVEVAFDANINTDVEILAQGGSIAPYATNKATPEIPVWLLVFGNARLFFVGGDDIPVDAKNEAALAVNEAFEAGWQGFDIAEAFPLDEIVQAHEAVEHPKKFGRVIIKI